MELDLVEKLVLANRILTNEGILDGFGHVSVRPPGRDELLVSSYGSAAVVQADEIITMDFDGNILDNEDAETYSETAIHRAIYRHRDDVNAVIHHHDPAIMPFTVTDVEIKPVFHMGALFYEGIPLFDAYDSHRGRLIVGREESDRMADELGHRRAQLLEGHGANVVGSTLEKAVVSAVYLSLNAKYQWQAELLGSPRFYTEDQEELQEMTDDIILAERTVNRMWEFLLERL
ncbi:class II aldolase/adducin family protein [Halopenitus malekzadehii]|nr:class II aldolase/adducin family protein [Halopenitus malekzadehii]